MCPGIVSSGSSRKRSSVASSQTRPDLLIAAEYRKPSRAPAARPTTPARDGPILLSSGRSEWQVRHALLKRSLPSLACAETPLVASAQVIAATHALLTGSRRPPKETQSTDVHRASAFPFGSSQRRSFSCSKCSKTGVNQFVLLLCLVTDCPSSDALARVVQGLISTRSATSASARSTSSGPAPRRCAPSDSTRRQARAPGLP